ncbi:hypothetical protein ACS0TY_029886 [Phlomoides rotata]
MGSTHNFVIFFLILVISTRLFNAQGRKLGPTPPDYSKVSSVFIYPFTLTACLLCAVFFQEEKTRWRVRIGSRPPRCERRCDSCGHCEAIQVPTNPPPRTKNATSVVINGRDYGNSNYKPMSWKCKCGSLFFNP